MPKFDLMKNKPRLDIPTLNFIWDTLWRLNACPGQDRNASIRAIHAERERILKELQRLADEQT